MAHALIGSFLVKSLGKKGFLLMFRDGTGDIYIVPEISVELGNNPHTEIPKMGLKPSYTLGLNNLGRLDVKQTRTIKAEEKACQPMILALLKKETFSDLNRGYLNPELLRGIALHNIDLKSVLPGSEKLTSEQENELADTMVIGSIIDTALEDGDDKTIKNINPVEAKALLMERFRLLKLEKSGELDKMSTVDKGLYTAKIAANDKSLTTV
jgi:hypothetical protein